MQLTQAWEDERKLERINEEENNENNYNRKNEEKEVIIKRKGCFYKDPEKISETLKITHPMKEEKEENDNNEEEKIEVEKEEEEIVLENEETVTDLNTETINKILTKV